MVIPPTLRTLALRQLHTGHFGINKMKAIAREHCWWPGIDQDIQSLVENCVACNESRHNQPKVEQHRLGTGGSSNAPSARGLRGASFREMAVRNGRCILKMAGGQDRKKYYG